MTAEKREETQTKALNDIWHLDSYDKLSPFGIGVDGCVDGLSNAKPEVSAAYFISELGGVSKSPPISSWSWFRDCACQPIAPFRSRASEEDVPPTKVVKVGEVDMERQTAFQPVGDFSGDNNGQGAHPGGFALVDISHLHT